MRICLLTDAYQGSDSPLAEVDLPCDPRPFLPEAGWTWTTLEKASAVRRVRELAREGFDLFFNLCDGARDEDRPGIEVVRELERLGVPFTGAGSAFFDPSREAMKRVCRALGLEAPAGVFLDPPAADGAVARAARRAADELRFPLIVKHPGSYSSIGLTPGSRVEDAVALEERVREMTRAHGGALIEEFIEGREFTVLVSEAPGEEEDPVAYRPIRFRFPEGESFKHYHLKWVDYHGMEAAPVEDPELDARLRDVGRRFFEGMGGSSYGRLDVRVDREGRLHVLEINPNCGIYYPDTDPGSADLCLLHDPAGHVGFTRRIVRAAFRRRDRNARSWEVRTDRGGSSGLYATRPIAAGETILRFEEREHVLVTRSRVEREWEEPRLSWFRRYAWPLTDEVYVIWPHDPEEWKPVNHSCDPNAWLDGLDVAARRDIGPGEEITLDYATFMGELMPSFECECGAPACRGTIRGTDHLEDFVARYGDHVSDWVRRKREALAPARRV